MVDLGKLREGPFDYLGWTIEGKAEPFVRYWCYAWADDGAVGFRVRVNGRGIPAKHEDQYVQARELAFALARGKIFLDTWSEGAEYLVDAPLVEQKISTHQIRDAILLGLFRLHESGFPTETMIELDGISAEMGVSNTLVDRAVKYLYDNHLIEDFGIPDALVNRAF
jgi:hypothetical protein